MNANECSDILNTKVKNIDGQEVNLCQYQGKVLLIVNTASRCGFTKQYENLQILYEKYKDLGFEILAFPSNDFAGQEPSNDEQIKKFCKQEFAVKFPLFGKISVKGKSQSPLYQKISSVKGEVQWNFQKYLINKKGQVVNKFAPWENPLSGKVIKAIEEELKQETNK